MLKDKSVVLLQDIEEPNLYEARELELVQLPIEGVIVTKDFNFFAVIPSHHPWIVEAKKTATLAVGNNGIHFISPISLTKVLPFVREKEHVSPFVAFLGRRGLNLEEILKQREILKNLYGMWLAKEVDFYSFLENINLTKLARDLNFSKPGVYKWKSRSTIPRKATLEMLEKLYGIKLVIRI